MQNHRSNTFLLWFVILKEVKSNFDEILSRKKTQRTSQILVTIDFVTINNSLWCWPALWPYTVCPNRVL
jgi:hypothetical protein